MSRGRPTKNGKIKLDKHTEEPSKNWGGDRNWGKWILLAAFVVFSPLVRWYNIDKPNRACWDEAFFVQMGSNYINRQLFFDLHPPLGKMLIGASGYIFGYDGTSSYEPDPVFDYHKKTPYVGMRMICAFFGAQTVSLSFETVWLMTDSIVAATVTGLLLMLDCGMITITRHILLDTWLLFGITMSVFAVTKFRTLSDRPFSIQWWFWLTLTGTALGFVVSVKLVGLFVVSYVGLTTIVDFWYLLADRAVSFKNILQQFISRAACLIILPILMYMLAFYIHFILLHKSSINHDGFYTPAFQVGLSGNSLNMPRPSKVAYGSEITIKNHRLGGGYLHYSFGMERKVMPRDPLLTSFVSKDGNNRWTFQRVQPFGKAEKEPVLVRSGDVLHLAHIAQEKMFVTKEGSVITRGEKTVSCHSQGVDKGTATQFKLVAKDKPNRHSIDSTKTVFQIVNIDFNCVIKSRNGLIPGWTWEHMEVTCTDDHSDDDSYWIVEEVTDDRLPKKIIRFQEPHFIEKFIEVNFLMLRANEGLVPSADEIFKSSKPWEWPLNYKGQHFSLNGDIRVYLLGNPVIWWGNLATMVAFMLFYPCYRISKERGFVVAIEQEVKLERSLRACWWLMTGWVLHYLPFFIMGRLTYVHHYYPALVFNTMLTGVFLECVVHLVSTYVSADSGAWAAYQCILGSVICAFFYSFYYFLPLAYGLHGPTAGHVNSTTTRLQWLKSWEI